MKLQEQTLSVFFLLLCGRSLIVSSFQPEELQGIKRYVRGAFNFTRQYAYVAKFTQNECEDLTEDVIENALRDDMDNIKNINLSVNIYEGTRMVMASFTNNRHAEYRLLFPNNTSPVQRLLNDPAVGCAMFYTYLSPCVGICTNVTSQYYIVTQLLRLFNQLDNNNKAFVYSQIYNRDQNRTNEIINGLRAINAGMPVFRCDRACIQCFINGVIDNNCVPRHDLFHEFSDKFLPRGKL